MALGGCGESWSKSIALASVWAEPSKPASVWADSLSAIDAWTESVTYCPYRWDMAQVPMGILCAVTYP